MENKDKPINPLNAVDGKLLSESDEEYIKGAKLLIGLSKREYFAGLAMQSMVAWKSDKLYHNHHKDIIEDSISLADELLKQLEQ